ncbi:MAG: diguanylate cyclase [Eubacterium sp.]|nr:diguanylate cyclase [Eubacterium sp.]
MHEEYIPDQTSGQYSYDRFLKENNKIINKVLNVVLWLSTPAGPLIALFILLGVFTSQTYLSCLIIMLITLVLAVTHSVIIRKAPDSQLARYFVLIGLDILFVYMRAANINIILIMFAPPLLSLLYCERKIYLITSAVSYVGMIAGVWLSADHWSSYIPTETSFVWFRAHALSYTLEYLLIFVVGLMISILINWHMGTTFSDKLVILDKEREAYTDKMTGLWNKMYLQKAYVKYVVQQRRLCALIIVDLDNFKEVNDKFGHSEGDRALVSFSRVFEKIMESIERAVLCRFGGDEFIAFLPEFDNEAALNTVLSNLKNQLKMTFADDEHLNRVTMSIGAVIMKNTYEEYTDLFEKADNSVLYVKNRGKDGYHIYHDGDVKEAAPTGR